MAALPLNYSAFFHRIYTVDEYVAIPQALIDALQSQGGFRREAEQYSNSADGVLSYVFDIWGYAEAILRALPRTAQTMDQMPLGRVDSLCGWVIEYIIQASLIFDIMMAWARISATTPWVDSRALKAVHRFFPAPAWTLYVAYPKLLLYPEPKGERETSGISGCGRKSGASGRRPEVLLSAVLATPQLGRPRLDGGEMGVEDSGGNHVTPDGAGQVPEGVQSDPEDAGSNRRKAGGSGQAPLEPNAM
ncbi:hypothetical protein B0H11DRAFT_2207858 [Mycena galericulata]|nr:hypothetical protein B0H11DRAFT_2207858 [Mycena galericulata]